MPRNFYGNEIDEPHVPMEIPGEVELAMLSLPREQKVIGPDEVKEAARILQEYKRDKANLETRIIEDEDWWKLNHWQALKRQGKLQNRVVSPEPTSGWLFNAILNKHADMMDNYPQAVVLPRERSDENAAHVLSEVVPVIMEQSDFLQVYRDNAWEKLKHGTAAYGVFWNTDRENGLGDIDIKELDLLNIFWEPGIRDIQKSRNLFIVDLQDDDLLEQQYPELKGKLKGSSFEVASYIYDDTVDTSEKSAVIDWYYKVKAPDGRTVLHFAKFVGDTVLYASENDPACRDRGWYDHGRYPVVLDAMFPEKGTPIGFGYVAICKDPQLYIDKLSGYVLEKSMMATKQRYFLSKSTNINKKQLLDWNEPIVDVEGELSDTRIKDIDVSPVDGNTISILQMKIDEMKDTAGNRDVNSGGSAGSGVTAAAAIAALQEAGNKTSRDLIDASYRAFRDIVLLVIELIRQFYDETRTFRVTGPNSGEYEFVDVSNAQIKDQELMLASGQVMYRRPVFDLDVRAQKKNPFSIMEQNERAKELYAAGFFNPERAQEAQGALEMMEFEGIDKVRDRISEGATLLNIVNQQQQQINQLMALISGAMPAGGSQSPSQRPNPSQAPQGGNGEFARERSVATGFMDARGPQTGYAQRLAERSKPSMDALSDAANPGGSR